MQLGTQIATLLSVEVQMGKMSTGVVVLFVAGLVGCGGQPALTSGEGSGGAAGGTNGGPAGGAVGNGTARGSGGAGPGAATPDCPELGMFTDPVQVGYAAKRLLLECADAGGGTTEICISDDATTCPGSSSSAGTGIACSNLCTMWEYGLSYSGVGPSAAPPSVGACRLCLQTPGGVAFYCCPCSM